MNEWKKDYELFNVKVQNFSYRACAGRNNNFKPMEENNLEICLGFVF